MSWIFWLNGVFQLFTTNNLYQSVDDGMNFNVVANNIIRKTGGNFTAVGRSGPYLVATTNTTMIVSVDNGQTFIAPPFVAAPLSPSYSIQQLSLVGPFNNKTIVAVVGNGTFSHCNSLKLNNKRTAVWYNCDVDIVRNGPFKLRSFIEAGINLFAYGENACGKSSMFYQFNDGVMRGWKAVQSPPIYPTCESIVVLDMEYANGALVALTSVSVPNYGSIAIFVSFDFGVNWKISFDAFNTGVSDGYIVKLFYNDALGLWFAVGEYTVYSSDLLNWTIQTTNNLPIINTVAFNDHTIVGGSSYRGLLCTTFGNLMHNGIWNTSIVH